MGFVAIASTKGTCLEFAPITKNNKKKRWTSKKVIKKEKKPRNLKTPKVRSRQVICNA